MNVTYEIDRKDFEKFLSENPERVFDQNSMDHCSLAEYLASTGLKRPWVLYEAFGSDDVESTPMPYWAQGVTKLRPPDRSAWEPYPFTSKEILDFLTTLPEEKQ